MNKKNLNATTVIVPSRGDWKRLYELIILVRELAPWDWMAEDDIFGIQMPDTGELGFVSVMGALGEHYSVAVYQGVKGLDGFWKMQEQGPKLTPEFLLEVPQLQASLENREEISAEDRAVMKDLGLKFRGAKAWPQFRAYRPGCLPWYIQEAEAKILICALEQLLDVSPRFKDDPGVLFPTESDDDYLVRVNKGGKWEDSQMRFELPYQQTIKLQMNIRALEVLKGMMPGNATVEADFFMMTEPVQDNRKERPFFPYLLMLAEHDSGVILESKLLRPFPTLEAMWEQIPAMVVERLAATMAPKEIFVQNNLLEGLLLPVGEELGIKIKKVSRLTAVKRARREFDRFASRR